MKRFIIITVIIYFNFSLLSCGGGGGGDTPTPPPVVKVPGPVTLVSPINNKACEDGTVLNDQERSVTFNWNTATDTETYDLSVTNLTTNQVATLKTGITTTSATVTLKKGTPYSWNVVSKSTKTAQMGTSPIWKLYVSAEGITNYAPFPATINAPKSGITVTPTSNKVSLDWTGTDLDSNTLTYTIYIDKIDGKQTPQTANTNITVQKIDVTVEANTNYFWRVKTSDGFNSSYTIVYTFKTN